MGTRSKSLRLPRLVVCAALALFTAAGSAAAAPSLPLKLSEDGRRLVDQDGIPFLVNGDAGWSVIVELTKAEAEIYLEDRRQKGFTLIMVNLLEHRFSSDPPNNRDGENPFLLPGDYSMPNEAYFDHADWVIEKAAEKGLVFLLTPSYLGYNGGNEGWWQEMLLNGEAVLRDYGRWLGDRYKTHDNIVWLDGGDYSPPDHTLVTALAEGILENDPNHLHSVHTSPNESAGGTYPEAAWLDVGNTYTYNDAVYVHTLEDWNRIPFKPFLMLESHYEENWIDPPPERIRRQAWWPMFTGAQGHIMGNFPVWYFGDGWEDALDSPGAEDMVHFGSFFSSIPWPSLVPDQDGLLLTGGAGTFGQTDWVTVAKTADGSFAAAYIPPTGSGSRDLTFDLTALDLTTVRATWFNPADGSSDEDLGSPYDGSADAVVLSTPGNNGGGANDWVLTLSSAEGENLGIDKLSLKLDFQDTTPFDAAKMSLRPVGFSPPGDNPAGVVAAIDVAGAVENITFDAKGKAATARVKARLRRSSTGDWSMKVVMKSGMWSTAWAAAGLIDTTVNKTPVSLAVTVSLNAVDFVATADILYSATMGRSGKAKLAN